MNFDSISVAMGFLAGVICMAAAEWFTGIIASMRGPSTHGGPPPGPPPPKPKGGPPPAPPPHK